MLRHWSEFQKTYQEDYDYSLTCSGITNQIINNPQSYSAYYYHLYQRDADPEDNTQLAKLSNLFAQRYRNEVYLSPYQVGSIDSLFKRTDILVLPKPEGLADETSDQDFLV